MRAAVERVVGFDPVTDDPAAAVIAHRRHAVNGALETVERVSDASGDHLKGAMIVVTTDFAFGHDVLLRGSDSITRAKPRQPLVRQATRRAIARATADRRAHQRHPKRHPLSRASW